MSAFLARFFRAILFRPAPESAEPIEVKCNADISDVAYVLKQLENATSGSNTGCTVTVPGVVKSVRRKMSKPKTKPAHKAPAKRRKRAS